MTWIKAHRQDVLIGVVAALAVVIFVIVSENLHTVGFPLDDSWIHQTYARNLAERGEWAFVPGESSVASTSPLYTVLLSIGYVLTIPFLIWTFALGALALAGAGWIGSRLGPVLFPKLPGVSLWTGLAMVLLWHHVWAAASGMETMLFATLSLAVVGLAWRELNAENDHPRAVLGRGAVLGLVGAALTLTRPEGVGLVALTGLAMAWFYGGQEGGWRTYLFWASGVAVGWGIGVLPYLALNYHIEGTLLPNTSSAKQAENAPARALPLLERYGRMLLPLVAGGQLILLPGFGVALYGIGRRVRTDRKAVLLLVPLLWTIVLISAYAIRLPAPYQHGRYVIPVLPHMVLYGVGGTLRIVRAGRGTPVRRVLSRSLGLSAALITLGFFVIGAQQYARDVRIINTEMVDTAHWVKDNLPPGELLAVHDIGALGYYAPRPILDLAGLVSPEIVPIILDHEALMQLMCERDARYLMVLPDQLPARPDDPRLGTETQFDSASGQYAVKPLFTTDAPYSPAAGGGNMTIYELRWPQGCR
jgi:hypothetical protein